MSDTYLTVNPKEAANEAIEKTMRIAENGHHTPGSWRDEGALHHLRHAYGHIVPLIDYRTYRTNKIRPSEWEDIEHALTRLAMALENHKRGLDGDYGTEGKGK